MPLTSRMTYCSILVGYVVYNGGITLVTPFPCQTGGPKELPKLLEGPAISFAFLSVGTRMSMGDATSSCNLERPLTSYLAFSWKIISILIEWPQWL